MNISSIENDREPLQGSHENIEEHARRNRTNLLGFWLLGLTNNYGYVVMLSAAHDILSSTNKMTLNTDIPSVSNHTRTCNPISAGAVLLADILPSLGVKLIAPFLPFHIHSRVVVVIVLSLAGFVLVGLSNGSRLALLGVISTSFSSGLGEVTFMAYSSYYNRNVVSAWSSGTGGAGVIGAISYAGLTSLGLKPSNSLFIMLIVPCIMAIVFWGFMDHSNSETRRGSINSRETEDSDSSSSLCPLSSTDAAEDLSTNTWKGKLRALPPLLKFMIPLAAVYFLEYFINQGLLELVDFPNIWLDQSEQYRWLQVLYQIGVFISRSSVSLVSIKRLWLLAVFQGLNVVFLTSEVIYFFVPSIWIVFGIVMWEGLLGGACYVNTFDQISQKIPAERLKFSLGITCLSDAIGITLAGFAAIPAHNFICNLH